ncbi:MAG: phosphodiester glycosidase family protein [Clostridia bacterium]
MKKENSNNIESIDSFMKKKKKKFKHPQLVKVLKTFILFVLFQLVFIPILSIILIFYGPFTNTRDMIVTTAMTTMRHQYFATLFLSDEKINEILDKNRPEEKLAEQEIENIEVKQNVDDGIDVVDVSSNTFKGYMMIVNDPSRVKVATAPRIGKVGSTTSQIIDTYGAIAGINAGGFNNDAYGTGGSISGVVIQDGKLMSDDIKGTFRTVGLDDQNRMIVSNSMTYSKMKQLKLKNAVTFGPVLIINGRPTIRSGDGGWGIQPRTAIGQRKDGTILMLVIDGRQKGSIGATLKTTQDIFLQYDAYNAFNLDGGNSTTMVYNSKLVNKPCDVLGERYVPSAFIVTKPGQKVNINDKKIK